MVSNISSFVMGAHSLPSLCLHPVLLSLVLAIALSSSLSIFAPACFASATSRPCFSACLFVLRLDLEPSHCIIQSWHCLLDIPCWCVKYLERRVVQVVQYVSDGFDMSLMVSKTVCACTTLYTYVEGIDESCLRVHYKVLLGVRIHFCSVLLPV